MSNARLALAALVATTAGACAGLRPATPPSGPARPAEVFTLAGASVAIENPAGAVRVEPGQGPDVRVTVTRFGADADRLRVERQSQSSGDILRIVVAGPASRRLLYPTLPGRSDSIQFRATRSGYVSGRGGFLGLFGGRTTKVVRRPGKAASTDAHADLVVSVPTGHRVDVHVGAGEVSVSGDVGVLHLQSVAGDFDLASAAGRIAIASTSGGVSARDGSGELTIVARAGSVDVSGFRGTRLEATTSAGTIRGAALTADRVRLHAGAGGIDVTGARGTGVDLRSGSGRVAARDVAADTLQVMSGVGDVTLVGLRAGAATVRSRKGDVLAGLAAVPSSLVVRADGGAVLGLPAGAGADLALHSEHGRIRVEGPASASALTPSTDVNRRSERSLVTRWGGGGGRIEVRAEHDILLRPGSPDLPAETARLQEPDTSP